MNDLQGRYSRADKRLEIHANNLKCAVKNGARAENNNNLLPLL